MTGCTVGWLELRTESKTTGELRYPSKVTITLKNGTMTDASGYTDNESKYIERKQARYKKIVERALCARPDESTYAEVSDVLSIEINEVGYYEPLEQEFLTGLSFGIIPSWGTRSGQFRFSFAQGNRTATYAVDDRRINHLIFLPVFWISFVYMDEETMFEKALDDFLRD